MDSQAQHYNTENNNFFAQKNPLFVIKNNFVKKYQLGSGFTCENLSKIKNF
jgi:hypothetical protein